MFTLLRNNEKCPSGEKCFKNKVDWHSVKEYIEKINEKKVRNTERHEIEKRKENNIQKSTANPDVIRHLEELYPDSYSMVDYLEFMGLDPSSVHNGRGHILSNESFRDGEVQKED